MSTQFPSNSPQLLVGVQVKTADYNVALTDHAQLLVMNSSSAHTFTLLATPPTRNGWFAAFKNIGTGTCTVARNGNNIDGSASSITLSSGAACVIASDGSTYYSDRGAVVSVAGKNGVVTLASSDLTDFSSIIESGTTAGGDLSSTYPNPTVAKVNGAAVPTSAGFVGTNSSKQIIASAYTPENPANKDVASGYAGLDANIFLKLTEQCTAVNPQTGTSYSIVDGDRAKSLTFSNTSAVAVSLPQAGASSLFKAGWFAELLNLNKGAVTITPTTSTINGAASIQLSKFNSVLIVSDGSNYFAHGMFATNTPSDGYVPVFVGATGDVEWVAPGAVSGISASQLRGKNISTAVGSAGSGQDYAPLTWVNANSDFELIPPSQNPLNVGIAYAIAAGFLLA